MAMTLMYNNIQFAPVTTRRSIVIPHSAEVVWSVAKMFGRAATWMGSIAGERSFSQLLGGETVDYIGAVRVFGISDKLLFEQLVRLDNQDMIIGWQLMTHPMNSNPFPAAFVNFKGELQVWPVTIPANGAQCFVEWRMDLLTELHAVELMTNSMNNIMALSLNNLLKHLEKGNSNSGGSSAGSHTTGGGSASSNVPPQAYGVQYMHQPQSMPSNIPSMSQGLGPGLPGSSHFLQQQSFVPGPGQDLGSTMSSAAINSAMGPFQQHAMPFPVHGPFSQQQYAHYQAHPGLYPQSYPQYPPQQFQQPQFPQQQTVLQQQQAAAYQLQRQTSNLGLGNAGASATSHHSSQHTLHRPAQHVSSSGSHKSNPPGQPGGEGGFVGPSGAQGAAGAAHESLNEAGPAAAERTAGSSHQAAPGQQAG